MIVIPIDKVNYGVQFCQAQLEVTDACNCDCIHCRVRKHGSKFVDLRVADMMFEFVSKYCCDTFELAISGGEPLLHPQLGEILECAKSRGINNISITTNGLLLTDAFVGRVVNLGFSDLSISVSVDGKDEKQHNWFRRSSSAFAGVMDALDLLANDRFRGAVNRCIRSTVPSNFISRVEDVVRLAIQKQCSRVVFSSVYPAGKANLMPGIMMDKAEKKNFIINVMRLKEKYKDKICVDVHDPLRCLAYDCSTPLAGNVLALGGCSAGTVSFNVQPCGNVTPCAMLDEIIMKFDVSRDDDYAFLYANSETVKKLVSRNFKGACFYCCNKYSCGGCRARALAQYGDYLQEDPDCWMNGGSDL